MDLDGASREQLLEIAKNTRQKIRDRMRYLDSMILQHAAAKDAWAQELCGVMFVEMEDFYLSWCQDVYNILDEAEDEK